MDATPETVTAHLGLSIGGRAVQADITVPTAPARVGDMLPVLQSLTNLIVGAAVEAVASEGRTVSCAAGCGACCRQLVPIAEPEARRIRDLVEALPEPRRATVRARFDDARRRLEQSGVLATLLRRDQWEDEERRSVGLSYFAEQVACPFLEDESCSIHPDRPMACREYLVTSPAANCARPTAETVACVKMPASVWTAVARLDPVAPSARCIRWVPLILAPDWADAHPEEPPPRPAPEILRDVLQGLTGKDVGLPGTPAEAAPRPD